MKCYPTGRASGGGAREGQTVPAEKHSTPQTGDNQTQTRVS